MKCLKCMEEYTTTGDKQPMVLDCSHTICKSCSSKLEKDGEPARCPTCSRRITEKPRINYAVRDLVAAGTTVQRCDNCEQSAATHYCLDCNSSMCRACMDFLHNMRALRPHTRCSVAEMPPPDMRGVTMLRQRVQVLEGQRNQAWEEVKRLGGEVDDPEPESSVPPEVRDAIVDQAMLATSPKYRPRDAEHEWRPHATVSLTSEEAAAPPGEPPLVAFEWFDKGHRWIGQRVARDFGQYGVNIGTIEAWAPAGENEQLEPALWHVQFDDGDDEDLEAHEVADAIELVRKQPHGAPSTGKRGPAQHRQAPGTRGPAARLLPRAGPGHWSRRPGIPQPLGPRAPHVGVGKYGRPWR